MKVVFDTNVSVSALTLPDGRGARALHTGDRAMLALGEYQGIRIVSLSAYLG